MFTLRSKVVGHLKWVMILFTALIKKFVKDGVTPLGCNFHIEIISTEVISLYFRRCIDLLYNAFYKNPINLNLNFKIIFNVLILTKIKFVHFLMETTPNTEFQINPLGTWTRNMQVEGRTDVTPTSSLWVNFEGFREANLKEKLSLRTH
jgi:hypothetical protein